MKTLETQRLTLRKFTREDFAAVHSYAASADNTIYMFWGPNTEAQTRAFIDTAITQAETTPCANRQYAAVTKATGRLIGACNLAVSGSEAEIGWILHRDHWRQGYGTEMGQALLTHGFDELGLHRIVAHCDAENLASSRVMEKIGMRREGLFVEGCPANKAASGQYGDELYYGLTKGEWDTQKEIAYYSALPVKFEGFFTLPLLSDGVIHLVCTAKKEAIPEKGWVPAYDFAVCKGSEKVGEIHLRVGYDGELRNGALYYSGQIGYSIDEAHRGNGYAVRACRLLALVAKAHGMERLLITNNLTNTAARRVCEKLGAQWLRTARVPEWHDVYKLGWRFGNIFEWRVE